MNNVHKKMTCLQIHNDYLVHGGETKTAQLIANLLEEYGVTVIRYYKSNQEIVQSGKIKKLLLGIKSIYNRDTVKDINNILDNQHVDFALVHNTSPIISNSIYDVLIKRNILICKYLQNYNLLCLNGAMNHGENCSKCAKNLWIGVKQRCYKNSIIYSFVKYIAKKGFDRKYKDKIASFMPNSEFVRDKHAKYGFKSSKMHVMYNYIEGAMEKNVTEVERKTYLYFGRISQEKGVFTVIKAFEKTKLNLFIMGTGELAEDVKKYIEDNKIYNIFYIGSKVGNELLEVVNSSKAVIVSSEWDEPLPRTILESYLQGTPVIGTNKGGIPEMIICGETGYIYKSGDVNELLDAISKMELLNTEQYLSMRSKCLEEAKEKYAKDKYFNRFMNAVGGNLNE